jgi:hypothetical protein
MENRRREAEVHELGLPLASIRFPSLPPIGPGRGSTVLTIRRPRGRNECRGKELLAVCAPNRDSRPAWSKGARFDGIKSFLTSSSFLNATAASPLEPQYPTGKDQAVLSVACMKARASVQPIPGP